MADPKQEETFKVVDRRLFTEQGDLRQEAIDQEHREAEAAPKAPPAKGAAPSAPTVAASGTVLSPESAKQADTGAAENEEQPSRNFQMLVDFLTRNAAAMLGGMADPRTGQAFLDLEGAREVIDMLDVLREKTRGNLAKADDDLLIEVLGSLKLTFMEISKAANEAMAKKATGKK